MPLRQYLHRNIEKDIEHWDVIHQQTLELRASKKLNNENSASKGTKLHEDRKSVLTSISTEADEKGTPNSSPNLQDKAKLADISDNIKQKYQL